MATYMIIFFPFKYWGEKFLMRRFLERFYRMWIFGSSIVLSMLGSSIVFIMLMIKQGSMKILIKMEALHIYQLSNRSKKWYMLYHQKNQKIYNDRDVTSVENKFSFSENYEGYNTINKRTLGWYFKWCVKFHR